MSYYGKSYYHLLYSHCGILAEEQRNTKWMRVYVSKWEKGIMGCVIGINASVDKWNNPPLQCTCLFVEGIWRFCVTCQCHVPSSLPPSPSLFSRSFSCIFSPCSHPFPLPLPVYFFFCVCLPIRVCDRCSLFVDILSALHIYKAERFTLTLTPNA